MFKKQQPNSVQKSKYTIAEANSAKKALDFERGGERGTTYCWWRRERETGASSD
jgi:hypothetical protein